MFMNCVQPISHRQQLTRKMPETRSDSDGGYLIEHRSGDRTKVPAATSNSFDPHPNVTDANDLQSEKYCLQSTSTNAGT
jgi:hypothetical protein